MSKILTVFGASGNQGGSVIKAVLADKQLSQEFKVRAVTRDSTKLPKEWTDKGVDVLSADMSGSMEDLDKAISGSHTVFLVTNFWATMSADTEVAQGKAVADACKRSGVQHLIFSSLINTAEASKGRLSHISHFDGKAKIEQYIRDQQIPATFFLPGYYMANFFDMIRKNDDGSYMLALPVSEDRAQLPLFDASSDTGKFVSGIIKAFPSCLGKRVYAATSYYTPKQIMSEFSGVIGKPASFMELPEDVFKSFLPPPVAQELLENQLLCEDPGYYAGAELKESLSFVNGTPTTWKEFAEANKAKW